MRRVRLLVLMVLAAGSLVLAACGGPDTKHPSTVTNGQSATGSVHPPGWGRPPAGAQKPQARFGARIFTMYDTVTLDTVPQNSFALAGYTAGNWPTYGPLRRAFPSAHTISIAIRASDPSGACLDDEPGDASPGEVPGWIHLRAQYIAEHHLRGPPCVYSSYFQWRDEIGPILAAAGIPRSAYYKWVADYTGQPFMVAGADATQYTDVALGRNLDASEVFDYFLQIAQPPYSLGPPPDPYALFSKINYRFGRFKFNEYHAVVWYDRLACSHPLRRSECKQDEAEIRALQARLLFVSWHDLTCRTVKHRQVCTWHQRRHPNYRPYYRGERNRIMGLRLVNYFPRHLQ